MTYKKSILINKKKDILFEIKIIKEQIIILNKIKNKNICKLILKYY